MCHMCCKPDQMQSRSGDGPATPATGAVIDERRTSRWEALDHVIPHFRGLAQSRDEDEARSITRDVLVAQLDTVDDAALLQVAHMSPSVVAPPNQPKCPVAV